MTLAEFLGLTHSERLAASENVASLLGEVEALVASNAEEALAASKTLQNYTPEVSNPSARARLLRAAATANAYLGRFDAALESASNAREIAYHAGDATEAARALVAKMHPLCESGKIDAAIEEGERARTELLDQEQPLLAARVDLNLGNVFKARGDAEEAIKHLDRVAAVLPDDDPIRPHALNALGECLLIQDNHVAAEEAFGEAATLLVATGGLASGIVVGNRGDVASRQGQLQEAIDLFRAARTILDEHGATGHSARLRIEMAEALESSGLTAEALGELEDAVPILERLSLVLEATRGHFAMGRIHLRNKHFELALASLHAAIAHARSLDNRRMGVAIQLAIAETCIAMGRLDEGAAQLDALEHETQGPYDETLLAHHRSLLFEALNEPERARDAAQRAVDLATPLNIKPLLVDVLALLAWTQRASGDPEHAIETGRRAVDLAHSIREGFHGHRLRAAFLASKVFAHEALVTALLDSDQADNQREAFNIVERARSRGLIERLMHHLGSDTSRDQDDAETEAIRRRLNALYTSISTNGLEDQRRLRSTTQQVEIDRLELELSRRLAERELAAPMLDDPIILEEVADQLPRNTALVEYFVSREGIVVFHVIDGSFGVTRLDLSSRELDRLVTELHFQCRRRLRGTPGPALDVRMQVATETILTALWKAVVEPLPTAVRRAERWMVVPHGALAAVPFHALSNGTTCLIDHMELSTAPSAAVAIRLAQTADRGKGTLVATVGDELAPSIQAEGDAVANFHPHTTRLDAEDATADRVASLLGTVRIAHLACHGRFLPGSPRSSGLRLADRWLTVRDIHELHATPPIVILSGCETGLHPKDGANELLGIAHGFAMGGSRAIVASLWSVNDEASTELMTTMHEWIARGETSVTTALRRAQLALRGVHPHPAFWAAFFCTESQVRDQSVSRRGATQ